MPTKILELLHAFITKKIKHNEASQIFCLTGLSELLASRFEQYVCEDHPLTHNGDDLPVYVFDPHGHFPEKANYIDEAGTTRIRNSAGHHFLFLQPYGAASSLSVETAVSVIGIEDQLFAEMESLSTNELYSYIVDEAVKGDSDEADLIDGLVYKAVDELLQNDAYSVPAIWDFLSGLLELRTSSGMERKTAEAYCGFPSSTGLRAKEAKKKQKDFHRLFFDAVSDSISRDDLLDSMRLNIDRGIARYSEDDVRAFEAFISTEISRFESMPHIAWGEQARLNGTSYSWWDRITVDEITRIIKESADRGAITVKAVKPIYGNCEIKRQPILFTNKVAFDVESNIAEDDNLQVRKQKSSSDPVFEDVLPAHGKSKFRFAEEETSRKKGLYKFLFSSEKTQKVFSHDVLVLDEFNAGMHLTLKDAENVNKVSPFRIKPGRASKTFQTEITVLNAGDVTCYLFASRNARVIVRPIDYDNDQNESQTFNMQLDGESDEYFRYSFRLNVFNGLEFNFDGCINGTKYTYKVTFAVKETKNSTDTSESYYDEHVRRNLLRLTRAVNQGDCWDVEMIAGKDISTLEKILLEEAANGLGGYPIVISDDYKGVLLSAERQDYSRAVNYTTREYASRAESRPDFDAWKQSLDTYGMEYRDARRALFEKLAVEYPDRCLEEIDLAVLDSSYEVLIENYTLGYQHWLEHDYCNASIADTIWVFNERDNNTLGETPNQVIVTPLHPLRIGWLYRTQKLMGEAEADRPSSAVSIFDSDTLPDMLNLPVVAIGNRNTPVRFVSMFAVRSSSRYWGVLTDYTANGSGVLRPKNLWSDNFGLKFEQSSRSITREQVESSLNDTREMCMAKPSLSISFSGTSSKDVCREGILSWNHQFIDESNSQVSQLGPRRLKIYDIGGRHMPSNETIAAISDQSGGAIQWFATERASNAQMDLSIATLAARDWKPCESTLGDSVNLAGGLACYRTRMLNNGAYVVESRRTVAVSSWREGGSLIEGNISAILTSLAHPACQLSNGVHNHVGFPTDIATLIGNRLASYYAISSADVDHACFVAGSGISGAYLWDYRLPQNHLGTRNTDGFYLMAKETPVMYKAVAQAISSISGGGLEMSEQVVANTLHITAQRGIPTIKDLTLGGTKALGEVGILIAVSTLQGDITRSLSEGLLPPYEERADKCWINFVIPFDPFRKHFEALIESGDRKVRPDLACISICCRKTDGEPDPISIKFSLVEVKARTGSFSDTDKQSALRQYETCNRIFKQTLEDRRFSLHSLAVYDFLIGLFTFGFRVFGTFKNANELNLDNFYTNVVSRIFSNSSFVSIEEHPRLLIVDSEPTVIADCRGGVHCTLRLNGRDACDAIARGNPMPVPVALEGRWGLLASAEPISQVAVPPVADTVTANSGEGDSSAASVDVVTPAEPVPTREPTDNHPINPDSVVPEQQASAEVSRGDSLSDAEIEAEIERVKVDLLEALESAGIEGRLIAAPKMAPNSIVFTFDGRPRSMSVPVIKNNAMNFMVRYGVEILRVVPKSRAVAVHVKRENRQVIYWTDVWPRVRPGCLDKKKLFIGIGEEDGGDLFLDPINKHGPHTLIAGATGSGKSVLLRNLLYSIGDIYSPSESRIILIDPKMGQDFFAFKGMPHFYGGDDGNPWIADQGKARSLIDGLVAEMTTRTSLLSAHQCENLADYQRMIGDPSSPEWIPRLWVFHDEFANWMLDRDYRQTVDSTIARLAVMARSVGIHLVFATQRPSNDVISMQTRSNLTNRLVLKVDTEGSSTIALGMPGAQSLLGNGHILLRRDGEDSDNPVEGQVAYHDKDQVKIGVRDIINRYSGMSLCEPLISRR